MLTLHEAIQLPAAYSSPNKLYLPIPNQVDVVITDRLAPKALTTTAFILPFNGRGLIGANNMKRGLEIPGGHIEPGETASEAAIRECFEETGYYVRNVHPIGFLRMTIAATVDGTYKYPHPISFQQFFVGTTQGRRSTRFKPNEEVTWPSAIKPKKGQTYIFYRAAREVLKKQKR